MGCRIARGNSSRCRIPSHSTKLIGGGGFYWKCSTKQKKAKKKKIDDKQDTALQKKDTVTIIKKEGEKTFGLIRTTLDSTRGGGRKLFFPAGKKGYREKKRKERKDDVSDSCRRDFLGRDTEENNGQRGQKGKLLEANQQVADICYGEGLTDFHDLRNLC